MSSNQYSSDVQFAGLIEAATAAADAQKRNVSTVLGKRQRDQDDSLIDTQLRASATEPQQNNGQLPPSVPLLQSSASVLFREPSEKSKKYSRPPLGKVYTDLELAPESFLRLQNAAKAYMLDEDHMERRDVVGHKKHSSNNDVAKLRLWECVEDFLNIDGNGEKWFGHSSDAGSSDTPARTFFWPEHNLKVIRLCMPLFRKMVTNERQRIYASETRKQDPNKSDRDKNTVDTAQTEAAPPAQELADGPITIDLTLDNVTTNQDIFATDGQQQRNEDLASSLKLHINVVHSVNDACQRLMPRFSIAANAIPTISALIAEAKTKYDAAQTSVEGDWFAPTVKVWLPDGLLRIKDDKEWIAALIAGTMVEWMDSEIRVIIDVGSHPDLLGMN